MSWTLHVEEGFSSGHSAGPPGHKCRGENDEGHGHDFKAVIEVSYRELDEYGWGPDFGKIKAIVKAMDHRNLNRMFDFAPTSENLAKYIYDQIEDTFIDLSDMRIDFVKVYEGDGNCVTYRA